MKQQTQVAIVLLILTLLSCATANESTNRRELQASAMRIFVEYTDSDTKWKSDATLSSKYLFSKKLMERTKAYYTAVLNVKSPKTSYTWPDTKVSDTKTVTGRTVAYDLWTYFYVYNKDSTGFAAAAPCAFDSDTGRAIVGYFELNLHAISGTKTLDALQFMGTFVHEFYHILVFNSQLFERFRDSSNNVIGTSTLLGTTTLKTKSRTTYKGSNVLSWAKTYLNFNSLTQIVLENDGGSGSAGSHWEHMYWSTDYMSPIDTRPGYLTGMSLNMAVDSGWFTINNNYVQEAVYGKNAGADIQTDTCPTAAIKGFCTTANEKSCGPDYTFKANCYTDSTYSEGCYFKWADVFCTVPDGDYTLDSTYDNLGTTSRCVMTTPQGGSVAPMCAKASCTGTTSVTYTFKNSKTCTCAGGAPTCTDATVSVTCPSAGDITDICNGLADANKCPNECNGKGICLGSSTKTCFCSYGWTGNDCGTASTTETDSAIGGSNASDGGTTASKSSSKIIIMELLAFLLIVGVTN